MRSTITSDVLKTMVPQEYENWWEGGEGLRHELAHAVTCDLDCPAHWDLNSEYRSEFGGLFPVQTRFAPSHGNSGLTVCSPGDISLSWVMMLIPASGRFSLVTCTLPAWLPEVISHTLGLVARLDVDGYSQASIISVLAVEGTL